MDMKTMKISNAIDEIYEKVDLMAEDMKTVLLYVKAIGTLLTKAMEELKNENR